jgi:uncharacterized protein YciI
MNEIELNRMKNRILLIAIIFTLGFGCQSTEDERSPSPKGESVFDEQLAKDLGTDDYGMKRYVMAFLKSGPNRDQDSLTAANLQKAHLQNIERLAEIGKLVMAGPFLDDGEIRGIYIFNVETREEAEKLTKTDPAIRAGRLEMELHPWYGSAGIQQLSEIHKRITRTEF